MTFFVSITVSKVIVWATYGFTLCRKLTGEETSVENVQGVTCHFFLIPYFT